MSKFKVGDKVALDKSPYIKLGCITNVVYGYCIIEVNANKYRIEKIDDIVLYQEIPDMSDDEIYDMLKPKMDKAGLLKHSYYYRDHTMFYTDEVIGAIALAYRSGYLRAKKGRPFKIGGEKE